MDDILFDYWTYKSHHLSAWAKDEAIGHPTERIRILEMKFRDTCVGAVPSGGQNVFLAEFEP